MDNMKCLNPWDPQSKRQYQIDGVYCALNAGQGGGGQAHGICYESRSIMMGFDAYNLDSTEDKAKTITAGRNDTHNIPVTCYGISAYNSNAMMSSNPHSGIYEAKTSRTLDLNGGNPACNQGGMIVIYDGQSCASNTETAYTIQASRVDDHHISVICHKSAGFVGRQGAKAGGVAFEMEKSPTLRSGITSDVVYCVLNDQGGGSDGCV